MRNSNIYLSIFCLTLSVCAFSQAEKITLRKGNEAYFGGKPLEATNYYSKSLKEKHDYFKANFNLSSAPLFSFIILTYEKHGKGF